MRHCHTYNFPLWFGTGDEEVARGSKFFGVWWEIHAKNLLAFAKHDHTWVIIFDNEFYALEVIGLNVVSDSVFIDIHANDVIFICA
jgi:hypothetical protein